MKLLLCSMVSFGATLALAVVFFWAWLTGKIWGVGNPDFYPWPGAETSPSWYLWMEIWIEPIFMLVVLAMSFALVVWHARRVIR